MSGRYQLWAGHVLDVLADLPAASVQACITSPPYYGLRAYGTDPQTWPDGWVGELGSEPDSDLFIAHLVEVFRAVRRVMRRDSVALINMGDSYVGGGGYAPNAPSNQNGASIQGKGNQKGARNITGWVNKGAGGVPDKNLLLIPQRLALALQADGWIIRSVFQWTKPNAMPESVQDRPTTGHEWWILATVGPRYFWDADSIRIPSLPESVERYQHNFTRAKIEGLGQVRADAYATVHGNPAGRNYRTTDMYAASLAAARAYHAAALARLDAALLTGLLLDADGLPLGQTCNTAPYPGAHFATFGEDLIRPWVRATTSQAGACPACGSPWRRVVERRPALAADGKTCLRCNKNHGAPKIQTAYTEHRAGNYAVERFVCVDSMTTGWVPSCRCDAGAPVPQIVLDPFVGTGTTVAVAVQEGRIGWGIDVSEVYLAEHARPRLATTDPLLVQAPPPVPVPVQVGMFAAPVGADAGGG